MLTSWLLKKWQVFLLQEQSGEDSGQLRLNHDQLYLHRTLPTWRTGCRHT